MEQAERLEYLRGVIQTELGSFGAHFREKLSKEFSMLLEGEQPLVQEVLKLYTSLRRRVVANVFIVPLEKEVLQRNQIYIIEKVNEKVLTSWFSKWRVPEQDSGGGGGDGGRLAGSMDQELVGQDTQEEAGKKSNGGNRSCFAYSYSSSLTVRDQLDERRELKSRGKYKRAPKPPVDPFDFQILHAVKKKIKKPYLWKNINTNILDLHESSKFIHSAKALFQLQSPLFQINNLVEKIAASKEGGRIETKVIKQIIQPDLEFNQHSAVLEKRVRTTLKQKEGDTSLRDMLYQGILSMREQLGEEEDLNYSRSLFFMRAGNPQGFIYQTYLLLYSLKRGFTMKKILEERMVCHEGFTRTISALIQIEGPDAILAIKSNSNMTM